MTTNTKLLEYYTSKTAELQAYVDKITIFVNYANFLCQHHYVNLDNYFSILYE